MERGNDRNDTTSALLKNLVAVTIVFPPTFAVEGERVGEWKWQISSQSALPPAQMARLTTLHTAPRYHHVLRGT